MGSGEKEIQNYDQIAPFELFRFKFLNQLYLCGQETVTCEGPSHYTIVGSILSSLLRG